MAVVEIHAAALPSAAAAAPAQTAAASAALAGSADVGKAGPGSPVGPAAPAASPRARDAAGPAAALGGSGGSHGWVTTVEATCARAATATWTDDTPSPDFALAGGGLDYLLVGPGLVSSPVKTLVNGRLTLTQTLTHRGLQVALP
jgi:hypothetical protein